MRAGRIDANQQRIVKYLRQCAMRVQILSDVGKGFPDLLVGYRGVNVLLEVKDGDKVPSKQKLTVAEKDWHDAWGGQVEIVATPEKAAEVVVSEAQLRGLL